MGAIDEFIAGGGAASAVPLQRKGVGALIWTFVGGALAMLAMLALALSVLMSIQQERATAERQRLASHQLAEELYRSSEDLTRMARSYSVTGKAEYRAQFHDILAIRRGELERPAEYNSTYWFIGRGRAPAAGGQRVALQTLLLRAGFEPAELALLRRSEAYSEALTGLEKQAFAALEGGEGRSPDTALARELLHGEHYEGAKKNIMEPLQEFRLRFDARLQGELARLATRERHFLLLLIVAVLGSCVLGVGLALQLRRLVVRPVRALARQSQALAAGCYGARSDVRCGNELQSVSEAFNLMAQAIERDILQRQRRHELVESRSRTDGLTGILNRRGFDEELARGWHAGIHARRPFSLLMIDLDAFKQYNDRYGHVAGDHCLAAVAAALKGALRRGGDQIARYGGEELAVLLPDTDAAGAASVAAAMLAAVRALHIAHEGSPWRLVTASIGVASVLPEIGLQPESLVLEADLRLYKAKGAGRNCSCSCSGGAVVR